MSIDQKNKYFINTDDINFLKKDFYNYDEITNILSCKKDITRNNCKMCGILIISLENIDQCEKMYLIELGLLKENDFKMFVINKKMYVDSVIVIDVHNICGRDFV